MSRNNSRFIGAILTKIKEKYYYNFSQTFYIRLLSLCVPGTGPSSFLNLGNKTGLINTHIVPLNVDISTRYNFEFQYLQRSFKLIFI